MQMLTQPFLEFNTNTKRIRICPRGTKMGFENGFGPTFAPIKTHIRRRRLNSAEIWNTMKKYVSLFFDFIILCILETNYGDG